MPDSASQPSRRLRGRPKPWRNVLSNWGAFLFTALVGFFISPFVVRSLGDSAYGAWILIGSLVGYMGLLDLGVRGAVTRFIAKFHAENDHERASLLASTALSIFLAIGIIAFIVAVILALILPHAFQIPEALVTPARIAIVLSGMTLVVSLLNGVYEGIIVGLQRFDVTSGLTIFVEALRAGLVVLLLSLGHGIVALAAIHLITALLRGGVSFALSHRLYPEIRQRVGSWDRAYVGIIFSFGVYSVLMQASGRVIQFADSIVISSFLPIAMVTFFAIAGNLANYTRGLVGGISHTVMPMASAIHARGEHQELRRVFLKGARVATAVVLPIVITFILRGSSFIGLWMGERYADLSGRVLWILSLSLWFEAGFRVVGPTMLGINRHKGLVPFFMGEAVVNIGLSIWWVQHYGIIGVAWGTTVPRLVMALVIGPWYVYRTLGVPMPTYWLHAWVRPSIAMIPFGLASYAMEISWRAPSLAMFFLQVALLLPIAAAGAWFGCLMPAERQGYRSSLARRLARNR